jgi:hypothetical protein
VTYKYAAKPTKVNGYEYASKLEARMARLLIEHRVGFRPHERFELFDRRGEAFVHIVDFLLEAPIKFVGIPFPIDSIEVKGRLTRHDFVRCEALSFFAGVTCWIALEPLICLWEESGMR